MANEWYLLPGMWVFVTDEQGFLIDVFRRDLSGLSEWAMNAKEVIQIIASRGGEIRRGAPGKFVAEEHAIALIRDSPRLNDAQRAEFTRLWNTRNFTDQMAEVSASSLPGYSPPHVAVTDRAPLRVNSVAIYFVDP